MTSTKQERTERGEHEREKAHSREAAIRAMVLQALGRPADLHQVQVRCLWESTYRVNVIVGADATSGKVVHSFIVTADAAGAVLASPPAIAKSY